METSSIFFVANELLNISQFITAPNSKDEERTRNFNKHPEENLVVTQTTDQRIYKKPKLSGFQIHSHNRNNNSPLFMTGP